MKSMKALIGRPVLLDGKAIGHVTEVELDEGLNALLGLYVDGAFMGTRRIEKKDVVLLGDVSVMVTSKGKRARVKDARMRRVRTADGCRIGAVTGALLDEDTMRVCALELSRGFLDDFFTGRQWVYGYRVNASSGDVLIEPEGGTGNGKGLDDARYNGGRAGGRVGGRGGFHDEPSHAQADGALHDGCGGQGGRQG